jgi:hypothetical protein
MISGPFSDIRVVVADKQPLSAIRLEESDAWMGNSTAALSFGLASNMVPAVAQHHAAKQKPQKPKTDAELIASAMSAAPSAVSKDATIVAVGNDGKLRTLRQGSTI